MKRDAVQLACIQYIFRVNLTHSHTTYDGVNLNVNVRESIDAEDKWKSQRCFASHMWYSSGAVSE